MALFPTLVPAPFEFSPGEWPSSGITAMDGRTSWIRLGNAEIGRELQLSFPNCTEATYLAILGHYRSQRSGYDPFGFQTATLPTSYTPAGHSWRYIGPPQVEDHHNNIFTVSCQFRSQPYGLTMIRGATWRSSAGTFLPGAMTDGRTPFANGVTAAAPAGTLTPGRFTTAALWTPSSLPGLLLWLDHTNTANRTVTGGAISQQSDQSGNARHATQATAGKRPSPGTGIAGLPCMTTTQAQYLELAATLGGVRTLVVAVEYTSPATAIQFLVGDAGTYDYHAPLTGTKVIATDYALSSASVRDGGGWVTGAKTAPVDMERQQKPAIYTFTPTGNTNISQFSADRSNPVEDRGLIGNHYAVVACSSVLSSEDRWKLDGYLAHRLSIVGDLPAAHPYRSILPTL